jgi:hypothetical protein
MSSQLGKPSSVRGENGIRLYLAWIRRRDVGESMEALAVSCCCNWADLQDWTLILTRTMDLFRNESADYISGLASNFASQTTALPDIGLVFSRQFRQWRESNSTAILSTASLAHRRLSDIVIANLGLYELYARLVTHSFGLQRAKDRAVSDLPASLIEVSPSSGLRLTRSTALPQSGLSTPLTPRSTVEGLPAVAQMSSLPL